MSNLLEKASIITTPTAYSDGKLHSVKPSVVLGSELVTNGGFDTDSDWTLGNGSYISEGSLILPNTGTAMQTGIPTNKMVRLDVQGSGNITYRLSTGVSFEQISLPQTIYLTTGSSGGRVQFSNTSGSEVTIDNVSVKEATNADFDFQRGSAATRVNSQGLIENVQTLSGNLVQNGDFSEIGSEEVVNGDFATDSDWIKEAGWTISNGKASQDGTGSGNNGDIYQDLSLDTNKIDN